MLLLAGDLTRAQSATKLVLLIDKRGDVVVDRRVVSHPLSVRRSPSSTSPSQLVRGWDGMLVTGFAEGSYTPTGSTAPGASQSSTGRHLRQAPVGGGEQPGPMIELPAQRHQQLGVFTIRQALTSGFTRHQVQGGVRRGQLLVLRRSVYTERATYDAIPPSERAGARAVAACLVWANSVVSHHSAALIHGLPLLASYPWRPALVVPRAAAQRRQRSRTVEIRAATLADHHVERRGEWSITTPARTTCDLAVQGTDDACVVGIDAGLARGLFDATELRAVIESFSGRIGHQRLRDAARQADKGSESPAESIARLRLVTLDLRPRTQIWAYDSDGPIGAGDLWIESLWCYLEVDGDVKYRRPQTATPLLEEKLRQERLEDAGFGVARIRAREAGQVQVISRRLYQASHRASSIRSMATAKLGWIGPPPAWARRGGAIDRTRPPTQLEIGRVVDGCDS